MAEQSLAAMNKRGNDAMRGYTTSWICGRQRALGCNQPRERCEKISPRIGGTADQNSMNGWRTGLADEATGCPQPVTDESADFAQHPGVPRPLAGHSQFVQYIHENHAKDGPGWMARRYQRESPARSARCVFAREHRVVLERGDGSRRLPLQASPLAWCLADRSFGRSAWFMGSQATASFEKPSRIYSSHIALDQNRPQIRSGEVRACKCNDWGNANAFFQNFSGDFLGNVAHPSKFWQMPIELLRGKAMYIHSLAVQIFNSHSCVLGRIKDSRLVIRICPWSNVKTCRIKVANFARECACWNF